MTKQALRELMNAGADKASAEITRSMKYEMNVESGDMSLIRTTEDVSIQMLAICQNKKGTVALNKTDKASISAAAAEAVTLAKAAQPDEANDIAPVSEKASFSEGSSQPDQEGMYSRLYEFLRDAHKEYPKTALDSVYFSFNHRDACHMNSNGVELSAARGYYALSVMGMGVDGDRAGSFNGTGFSTFSLDRPLIEYASVRDMLRMCTEQIDTSLIGASFEGDVIFSPDCFDSILEAYIGTFLSDSVLISGSSVLKDKLGEKVASELLTVRSTPTDPTMSGGYRMFSGFRAEDETILDGGILRAFDLSLYGANKTGLPRSVSGGGALVVDAGKTPYEDMVRSVKRGLLVCRFSGGNPTSSGDLSGVAKNSYYIEDGEIKFPVNETMIAGNLRTMFSSIGAVSKERTDFGSTILPSVLVNGVRITG